MADKVKFIRCGQDIIDLMNKWVNNEMENEKETDKKEESNITDIDLKK